MRELRDSFARENTIAREQHTLPIENVSKKRLVRRLTLFFALALTVITSLSITFYQQNMAINKQVAETATLQNEMNSLKDEESKLQEKIRQLNNDDYIAKIARSEYFFSKDGEINFPVSK
ncbi:FtsB family cell division protein [Ectobacillus polymachus]|uniref:FtsB family cell division protein n=1 Tax=Ectobacillus polymachus TaxID=1508806 RepID=UPI003A85ECCB